MQNDKEAIKKITVRLPHSVYHVLRNQAYQQNVSLPDFIRRKMDIKPRKEPVKTDEGGALAALPLREILAQTTPAGFDPDDRLDFFHG